MLVILPKSCEWEFRRLLTAQLMRDARRNKRLILKRRGVVINIYQIQNGAEIIIYKP